MNANIIKKHIIHEMKYDFKGHERSHVCLEIMSS